MLLLFAMFRFPMPFDSEQEAEDWVAKEGSPGWFLEKVRSVHLCICASASVAVLVLQQQASAWSDRHSSGHPTMSIPPSMHVSTVMPVVLLQAVCIRFPSSVFKQKRMERREALRAVVSDAFATAKAGGAKWDWEWFLKGEACAGDTALPEQTLAHILSSCCCDPQHSL